MSSDDGSTSVDTPPGNPRDVRLRVLFARLGELCGQRNAIDGQIVDIVTEIDHDQLWAQTGARSLAGLVAWKTGVSPNNANTVAAVARRAHELTRCTQGLRDGQLSLDQVGVIAQHGGHGSDEHYAQLATAATVTQLRTAVKLEPQPDPKPDRGPHITKTRHGDYDDWRIRLPHIESAKLDAALRSHRDALFAEWTHDHPTPDTHNDTDTPSDTPGACGHDTAGEDLPGVRAPLPTNLDAFLRLIDHSWDAEVTQRPHGQHTTVVVHVDATTNIGTLHQGPLLTDAERQYLTCDATWEIWFERNGQPIGCGRTTRTISRRLRRALEHRYPTCAVPGCGATHGLHAHHIIHWEHGGPTELWKLMCC